MGITILKREKLNKAQDVPSVHELAREVAEIKMRIDMMEVPMDFPEVSDEEK